MALIDSVISATNIFFFLVLIAAIFKKDKKKKRPIFRNLNLILNL